MKHTRVWAALGALTLGTGLGVTTGWAQVDNPFGAAPVNAAPTIEARTVYFWSAIGGAENVLTGKWGNGDATPARNVDYEGKDSLQVTTHSFGEGARFDLKTGVPIEPYMEKGYLRVRVRFGSNGGFGGGGRGGFGGFGGGADGGNTDGGFGGGRGGGGFGGGRRGGGRGGFGGVGFGGNGPGDNDFGGGNGFDADGDGIALPALNPNAQPQVQSQAQVGLPGIPGGGFGGGGGFQGGGGFGGFQGGGFGGGGRGGFGGRGGRNQSTTITQIQATLQLDRGILTTYIPIDLQNVRPDNSGWYLFPIRISDMKATPNAGGSVRRLILTSDADDTFYLAQAALVVDNGQLTLNVRRAVDPQGAQIGEITVRPGPLTLVADVEAGATDPEVTWNFDADDSGLPRTDIPNGMMGGRGMGEGGMMGGPGMAPGMAGTGRGTDARGVDPRAGGTMGGEGMAQQYGPRVDARGLTATFNYPNEEQDYRVEVTVRDRSGRKKPITSSILVKVRA